MLKKIRILVFMILSFCLIGCSGKNETEDISTNISEKTQSNEINNSNINFNNLLEDIEKKNEDSNVLKDSSVSKDNSTLESNDNEKSIIENDFKIDEENTENNEDVEENDGRSLEEVLNKMKNDLDNGEKTIITSSIPKEN